MNREYFFSYGSEEERWSISGSLCRWYWSILCCGVPGIPCSRCGCCRRSDEEETPTAIIHATETATLSTCERELPHRPHALRGRKSTPELMSAVRCALTQLQGQPATQADLESHEKEVHEKNALQKEAQAKDEKEVTWEYVPEKGKDAL